MIGGSWLVGEFDQLETVLTVRLGKVDGVENPDDDDGAGAAGLIRIGGIGSTDDENGVGAVTVCCRLVIRVALSDSCSAALCCLSSWLAEMVCTCFSPSLSFLLVASSAV